MSMLEKLKGYRTRIFAALTAGLGVVVALGYLDPAAAEGVASTTDTLYGAILVVVGAGIALFRQITTTGPGDSV
jgi:hypothetical protein